MKDNTCGVLAGYQKGLVQLRASTKAARTSKVTLGDLLPKLAEIEAPDPDFHRHTEELRVTWCLLVAKSNSYTRDAPPVFSPQRIQNPYALAEKVYETYTITHAEERMATPVPIPTRNSVLFAMQLSFTALKYLKSDPEVRQVRHKHAVHVGLALLGFVIHNAGAYTPVYDQWADALRGVRHGR